MGGRGVGSMSATRTAKGRAASARAKSDEQRRAATAAKAAEKQGSASKTFVNSYGKATTRGISATSYEGAQKRQQKAVLRNMGY